MKIEVVAKISPDASPAPSIHLAGVWRTLARRHSVHLWLSGTAGWTEDLPAGVDYLPLEAKSQNLVLKVLGAMHLEAVLFVRLVIKCLRDRPAVIYVRESSFFAPALIAGLLSIPLALEVNGAVSREWPFPLPRWLRSILDRLLSWQARHAKVILTVTDELARYVANHYHAKATNIAVVPNGVDTQLFDPSPSNVAKQELGLPTDRTFIGWVGAFREWQDLPLLLRAYAHLREADSNLGLLLVTPTVSEVRELASSLSICEDVVIVSSPHNRVPIFINACDLCIAPFVDSERIRLTGLSPLKVYEYLACGKPIISSRFPSLQWLEDEGVGFLYEPGVLPSLVETLRLGLELEATTKEAMGALARDFIVRHHSWQTVAGKVEAALSEGLAMRGGDARVT